MCRNHYRFLLTGIPEGYQDVCTLQFDGCTVEFYFSIMDDIELVLIENSNTYACPASTLPWIIAGSLVGAIILLGVVALVVVKLLLGHFVS